MKTRPLTLLELVITLALLAALTMVVFTMSGDMLEEGRYERTARSAEQIRHAIWNDVQGERCFLSDMGRLPCVKENSKSGQRLQELFKLNGTNRNLLNRSFDISPNDYRNYLDLANHFWRQEIDGGNLVWRETSEWQYWLPEFSMRSGWGGPYVSSKNLRELDGWGREWRILDRDGNDVTNDNADNLPANNTPIWGVMSYGSDNLKEGKVTTNHESDIPAFSNDIVEPAFKTRYYTTNAAEKPLPVELQIHILCEDPNTGRLYKPELPSAKLEIGPNYSAREQSYPYSVGNQVLENGVVYRCAAVSGDPGEARSAALATSSINLGYALYDRYPDSCIYWERHIPAINHLNAIRIMQVIPEVDVALNQNRPRFEVTRYDRRDDGSVNISVSSNSAMNYTPTRYGNTFSYMPNTTNVKAVNQLLPGKRKIWAMGYFKLSTNIAVNCLQSEVMEVNLKPGVNEITLILKETQSR